MRKIYLVLLFLIFLPWMTQSANAGFEEDYQTFLKTYDNYRTAKDIYTKTRNEYLTYGTLNSKNEALTGVKNFLLTRNDVLLNYNNLLLTRNSDSSLKNSLEGNNSFIKTNSEKIPFVGSLEDALSLSEEIENNHISFQITSRKVTGLILINKVKDIDNQFKSLMDESNNLIQTLKNQGKETASLERWLLDAKNKELLALNKLLSAETKINSFTTNNLENITTDYNQIQFTIFEANQYLKEGVNYLKELAQAIKYGKY